MTRIKWGQVLDTVDGALTMFRGEGVKPTLRTLFYYLVSKEVIPNTTSSYKGLSRQLVKARKSGRYAWDFLEDKTRVVLGVLSDYKLEEYDFDLAVKYSFEHLLSYFDAQAWADQPEVCEIWIEKEALASTIEAWTSDLRIPIRINRGYSSWTFIFNNVQALATEIRRHDRVTIFYLGDLDPSGVDMQRFLEEAIRYFGLDQNKVIMQRLAITPNHVERFNLPPKPEDAETLAKLQRDSRMASYQHEYIVELDALVAYVPSEFKRMVQEAIKSKWDKSIFEKLKEKAEKLKAEVEEKLEDIQEETKEKIRDVLEGV